jgi:Protein of unknown function (DUF2934)
MQERLIDVLNDKNSLLHVFPVKAEAPLPESEFEQEAVKAAIAAEIVSPKEAKTLRTRPHVSRGGPLVPYGDALQIKREQHIRQRAYYLWQADGCPNDRSDEYWHRACEIEDQPAA